MNIYTSRISSLQKTLLDKKIDICIFPMSDPHLSEYIPEYWKYIQWLSGFSGSAGILVITTNDAFLLVDGRYHVQAKKQLENTNIKMVPLDSINSFLKWIIQNVENNSKIYLDSKIIPLKFKENLQNALLHLNVDFVEDFDLISLIREDSPPLPSNEIFIHEEEFIGESTPNKIAKIRNSLKDVNYLLISSLDDIAWITNLRGSDVEYNPVFLSYLLISHDEVVLFVDLSKVSLSVMEYLRDVNIKVLPYFDLESHLREIQSCNVLLDFNKTTIYISSLLASKNTLINKINPSTILKSIKNENELNHIENAMDADGVALCKFFMWFEEATKSKNKINELDIADKLSEFRSLNKFYVSDSFGSIVGFNANGALPHYRASEASFAYIQGDGLLLIDSGAQYKNGTTDITRVFPIGTITKEHKRDYTLTLKAHINMTSAIFPKHIPMPLLDSLTRAPLWKEGIDYIHGTGHGVGYFLNVHEGPQVLSYFADINDVNRAECGMIISIEPGIYHKGKWGVRLENLVVLKEKSNFDNFLYFETLTMYPFESSCIDLNLLSIDEINWINAYHKKVFKRLSVYLEGDSLEWLRLKTREL